MLILKFLLLGMLFCAPQTEERDVIVSGPGVVNPKLAYKEEPSYSESAKRMGLQGDIMMALTIDENGIPRDALILSSLGQGLDEQAVSCVSRWRFKPATKDGRPVKFRATIDISFRIGERAFDSKEELRRTTSEAVKTLLARQRDGRLLDDRVKIMQDLADHRLPAAEYVVALWQIHGDVLPKDVTARLERIQIAAKEATRPPCDSSNCKDGGKADAYGSEEWISFPPQSRGTRKHRRSISTWEDVPGWRPSRGRCPFGQKVLPIMCPVRKSGVSRATLGRITPITKVSLVSPLGNAIEKWLHRSHKSAVCSDSFLFSPPIRKPSPRKAARSHHSCPNEPH